MTEAAQTEQETHLGTITDETPIGRVFEFDLPLRDPDDGMEYAKLTYTGTNDNLDVFCFAAAGESEEIAWPTEAWNRNVAPQVTGYRDTDGETAQADRDDEPADTPAHRMTPEQGKAVLDLRLKVRLAEQEEKEAKEVHDSKKKRVKSLQDQLNSMLDDIERGQMSLFNQAEAEQEGDEPEAEQNPDQEDLTEEERKTHLCDLGIKPHIMAKCEEHEPRIETLGDLVDWQRDKGEWWAKDIKGIGPEAREGIENALMRFWEQR